MRTLVAFGLALLALAVHAQGKQITLLHTNDGHGRHLPIAVAPGNATAQTGDPGRSPESFEREGSIGGFPRLAAAVKKIRAARGPENVILVNAGDTFSDDLLGNLTRGEAVMRLMKETGFQFMALGNHDFDYGAARTRELEAVGGFPLRGANVIDRETGEPFLGDPSLLLSAGGVRVALLALGYHNSDQTGDKKNVKTLRFTDGIDTARRLVPRLREQADVVVVVSHQGSSVDRLLAREVPGIDIIVGGHSHDEITPPERIGQTYLAQALSDTTELGELTVEVTDGRVTKVSGAIHRLWSDAFPPDEAMQARVASLRAPHRSKLEEVIAVADERIGRQYRSESPFDVLVGKMLCELTGAEVALLPGVGYGVSLSGPVTREALYSLLPHPAKVATATLTGAQLLAVLEQSARNQKPEDPRQRVGGLIQTTGMRWTLDLTRPAGVRIRDVFVGRTPLDPARTYRVVTHNGMLDGLHGYTVLGEARAVEQHEETVAQVVERRMRETKNLRAPRLGNITLIKDDDGGSTS